MRRHNLFTLLSVAFTLAILALGIGCKNHLLSQPTFGGSQNGTQDNQQTAGSAVSFGAPANLQSTQGGYKEITLTWNPVKDAARYNVYRASTQFDTFVQVGEAASDKASYTMKVPAGADFYYRVTAVNYGGEESPFSSIVRGTALATPLISGIEGVEGKEDSDVTVYWYMGNVDAYQDQVRYNVICYDSKGSELARVVVDGSRSDKTEAVIPNLTPNTDYQYKVEAYLITAQDKVEAGDPMDAATARRLRPNAPEELKVEQGQSTTGIALTFKLPELVDVALPGGLYEQKPLYFKIYRREFEEGSTDTEKGWELVKADFGKTETKPAENEMQKVKFGSDDEDYTPGKIVSWTDENKLNRGVRYEYKVQSFAYYERDITSKYSASIATGWLVAKADFRTGKYEPKLNEEEMHYISSTLGFTFKWNAMGLDDEYHFILSETRYNLEGDAEDKTTSEEKETQDKTFNTIAEVQQYVRYFDNLNTEIDVRGYYKYTLAIFNKNGTEILSLQAPGRAIVTDSVDVPVIKQFSVTSGYDDKIELQWKHNSAYKYTVEYTGDVEGEQAQSIDQETLYASKFDDYEDEATVTYTHTVGAGKKYEYILRVSKTISTDSLPIVGRTSVAPSLAKKDYSYDALTVEWEDVPAESFTLEAKYMDGTTASKYPIDPQELEGNDADTLDKETIRRTVTFDKPNGYTHATVSGKPVEITITAKVPVTRTVHTLQGETGSSYDITTENVETLELKNTIEHYTMGPAMVDAKADLGVYSDKIQLTWKKVEGAKAYVVIRNGFHISSNAGSVASDSATHLDFKSTDMYLVKTTGSDTWTVEHKPSNQVIEKYFSVAVAADTFTLTDNLYTDADSTLNEDQKQTMGQWIARQKEISWGAPYKYTVLPVLTDDDVPEYDYEVSPALATLESASLSLTDLPLENGTTKGYAWNVKATKGTYSENGENTGVKLTWTRPFTQASQADGYNVYRAEYDSDNWVKLDKSVDYGTTTYVDDTALPGTMYQYMVATGVTTEDKHPNKNVAWVAHHNAELDENYEGERLANGFVLPRVRLSVTRQKLEHTDATGGKERLSWNAQSVAGKTDYLFDGYIIEILNHNISGEWQQVAKLDFGGAIQKGANYTRMIDNTNGLLKVLRDYKHYFRVRTYTVDENGEEVLSRDDYQWADGKETDFVKWGARSLSADEWIKCATLAMSIGLERAKSNRSGTDDKDQWSASYGVGMNYESSPGSGSSSLNAFKNRSTILGIPSGDVYHQIKFNDYKPTMVTRSGQKVAFLTIKADTDNEAFYGETYSGTAIRAATDFCTTGVSGDFNSTPRQITIVSPSDVPGLYDAKISFWKFNPVRENGGGYLRLYPGHDPSDDGHNYFTRKSGSVATPFPCADNGSTFQNDTEEWK